MEEQNTLIQPRDDGGRAAPVARLDFLSSMGTVGERIEYFTETDFLKALKKHLYYGVPLVVVLYCDNEGKTISRNFLNELETMPKGLRVEDAPRVKARKELGERSDER